MHHDDRFGNITQCARIVSGVVPVSVRNEQAAYGPSGEHFGFHAATTEKCMKNALTHSHKHRRTLESASGVGGTTIVSVAGFAKSGAVLFKICRQEHTNLCVSIIMSK